MCPPNVREQNRKEHSSSGENKQWDYIKSEGQAEGVVRWSRSCPYTLTGRPAHNVSYLAFRSTSSVWTNGCPMFGLVLVSGGIWADGDPKSPSSGPRSIWGWSRQSIATWWCIKPPNRLITVLTAWFRLEPSRSQLLVDLCLPLLRHTSSFTFVLIH